jgi:hypothetical protein
MLICGLLSSRMMLKDNVDRDFLKVYVSDKQILIGTSNGGPMLRHMTNIIIIRYTADGCMKEMCTFILVYLNLNIFKMTHQHK